MYLVRSDYRDEAIRFAKINGFLPELTMCIYLSKLVILPADTNLLRVLLRGISKQASKTEVPTTHLQFLIFKRKYLKDCQSYEREFKNSVFV